MKQFGLKEWPIRYLGCTMGVLVAVATTFQAPGRDEKPTIRASVVTSHDLPAEFDSTRTYHYTLQCTNPESVLTALWDADVRVWQAWFPLDNMCVGPIGPQFTVELEEQDSAVLDFKFVPGDGRLHCAARLKRFVVSD